MKKRFTVMLDEKVIKQLKIAARYETPSQFRKTVEVHLEDMAFWMIQYYESDGEDIGTATVEEMRKQNESK